MNQQNKPKYFTIKDFTFDLYAYDFGFYEDFLEHKKIYIVGKINGKTHEWLFKKNNFDEMKKYDIIKENVSKILKPVDLSIKLPEPKEDTYSPGD